MTTAMLFFLLRINLDFYATMCHILIDGTTLTYTRSGKCNHRRTQASFPGGLQASWHKRKTTHWHNWQPMYLPPYSPDLNPIERIWLTMKARWFNNHVCKNEQKLLELLDQAILDVIDNPAKTQQTTAIGTLF